MKFSALAAAALLSLAGAAHADVTIFSDNFEGSATGLGVTPTGWTVLFGNVDTLTGVFGGVELCAANGLGATGNHCVDLEGTGAGAGGILLQNAINLDGGTTYTAYFTLGGSARSFETTPNAVQVQFGTSTWTSTAIAWNGAATEYSLAFTPTSTAAYLLAFQSTTNGDNMGLLLDNVRVTAVPEPETYALLAAGLGVLGFIARRRAPR